jgi:CheY-like chemotaxis protein
MSKTILIVEDDPFLQELETTKFKKAGYNVANSHNADEAFSILNSEQQVDIILLDLMLPEVDGFTILKKLRDDHKTNKIPVIIFSNLSEEVEIERAKALGISEFLVKSNFGLDDVTHKIKSLIGEPDK